MMTPPPAAEMTSSTIGWSTPDRRIIEPTMAMSHTIEA